MSPSSFATSSSGFSVETPVLISAMRLTGQAAEGLIEHKDGGHADERETSVMLALEPRSVRMDQLALAGPFEQTAATGDPRRATSFKGERLMAARIDDLVAALTGRWPDLVDPSANLSPARGRG